MTTGSGRAAQSRTRTDVNLPEVETAVAIMLEELGTAEEALGAEGLVPDVRRLAQVRSSMIEAKRTIGAICDLIDNALGDVLGHYETVIEGVGVVKRHKRKTRTKWDSPDLLRTVLDSRLVDKTTGEVKDESPLDRVLHVWNLGAPRATALKERAIQIDEYCQVEVRPGWQIEVVQ